MTTRSWNPKLFRAVGKDTETQERGLYRVENLNTLNYSAPGEVKEIASVHEPEKIALSVLISKPPNLIGSKLYDSSKGFGYHAPVIDLDFPCRLVESSTPNHYHLYLDVPIKKENYKKLLDTLVEIGLVQERFAQMLDQYGQTFVRWGALKEKNNT